MNPRQQNGKSPDGFVEVYVVISKNVCENLKETPIEVIDIELAQTASYYHLHTVA